MTLLRLLEEKHAADIFVPECTMGSGGSRRLDAWVLKPTWSPVRTIGYEIKNERSDWLRDDKWPAYLDVCHELWFVCPDRSVIRPEEAPEGCGLIYGTKNGERLYTKIKAKRREIQLPAKLMVSVLMNRAKILDPYFSSRGQRQRNGNEPGHWEKWLATKRKNQEIGRSVGGRIAEIARETADENESLRRKLRRWGEFRAKLVEHGVNPDGNDWHMRSYLSELRSKLPPGTGQRLRTLADQLRNAADFAKNLEES